MTVTIAVAGKGGVGKTTVGGLFIRYLIERQNGTVLAVDADPSSNLHMVLGLELDGTIGDMREDMLAEVQASLAAGGAAAGLAQNMTKRDYLNYHVRTLVSEGEHVDLIAMGRPEGPGCYCAVNHNLREIVDSLGASYDYVVIDNEAGLEHLSRRTTHDVDIMLIVSDPSQRGLVAAERVVELRDELEINIKHTWLVLNRLVGGTIPPALQAKIDAIGVPVLGTVPHNADLLEFEFTGRPLLQIEADSPVYQAVASMAARALADAQV
ncbi:MAG: AAA family ATPase [Anaerolineae bacterium]|nr:AAA family ATPase [Anaerolineae bacterium]